MDTDLEKHKDHSLALQFYGEREEPTEILIVCEDCNVVLYSRDASDDEPEDMKDTDNGVAFEELAEHVKDCEGLTYVVTTQGVREIRCKSCGTPLCWSF